MRICIIPARGGSKRIPRKNIRSFCGKPMIAWSIEAAKLSDCFDHIVVSTDDNEIAAVAKQCGASVPFRRPAELSGDHVATTPVVAHAINWVENNFEKVDLVCCLYATAPFVTANTIQDGLSVLTQTDADFAFSVTSFPFPIQRALRITPSNRLEMFHPEQYDARSQDLDEAWHDAGQFYWGRKAAWLDGTPVFGEASSPIILPRHTVQDIDTLEDWARAEWMFRAMHDMVEID